MLLRVLDANDIAQMANIEVAAHSHPMTAAMLTDCFSSLYRVTGLESEGQLLGFAIVHQVLDEATLFDICVAPEVQGQGCGALLLEAVLQEAKEAGAALLMLEVRVSNLAAIGLYQKCGFGQSGIRRNYYPTDKGREDALLMDIKF